MYAHTHLPAEIRNVHLFLIPFFILFTQTSMLLSPTDFPPPPTLDRPSQHWCAQPDNQPLSLFLQECRLSFSQLVSSEGVHIPVFYRRYPHHSRVFAASPFSLLENPVPSNGPDYLLNLQESEVFHGSPGDDIFDDSSSVAVDFLIDTTPANDNQLTTQPDSPPPTHLPLASNQDPLPSDTDSTEPFYDAWDDLHNDLEVADLQLRISELQQTLLLVGKKKKNPTPPMHP